MSFLWHDYETFGTHPAVDRPCQFAALRTDAELNPVEEPFVRYCAPADDVLPRPQACLVTGITPQQARREGVIEAGFARDIHQLMTEPNTCAAGYNSIRFDDEVTRHLLYRNLFDVYEREWKNGNSRWDLINLVRMCYALRPDGIEWPTVQVGPAHDEPGESSVRPSFRLEDLTRANGIDHGAAHDALADVEATIALARLVRAAQPRLFDWALGMRDKPTARSLLDVKGMTPVVHTSGRIFANRGCTSLVLPVARHPDNDKAVIVFDLMGNADALLASDADAIRDRVFTPAADLPDHVSRLPLKAIKWNAVPMLAPASVLAGVDLERIGLDLQKCNEQADLIRAQAETVRRSVHEAFRTEYPEGKVDPELALYRGGFFPDADRHTMNAIQACKPEEIGSRNWAFEDSRLPLMLLRYRARNWPETLDNEDWRAWQKDRTARLTAPADSEFYGLEAFRADLETARLSSQENSGADAILDALESWALELNVEENINGL